MFARMRIFVLENTAMFALMRIRNRKLRIRILATIAVFLKKRIRVLGDIAVFSFFEIWLLRKV